MWITHSLRPCLSGPPPPTGRGCTPLRQSSPPDHSMSPSGTSPHGAARRSVSPRRASPGGTPPHVSARQGPAAPMSVIDPRPPLRRPRYPSNSSDDDGEFYGCHGSTGHRPRLGMHGGPPRNTRPPTRFGFGLLGFNASATATGLYQGGEMMMKSVFWWRKPEYPEETTDLRQVTDETFHTYGLCPVRGLNLAV